MMSEQQTQYRQVAVGETNADAVTVGIEANADGTPKAAVWWEAKGDVDADEAEYDDVAAALVAAEAARALHGFSEVVVALQDGLVWQPAWGTLASDPRDKEPIGDVSRAGLSSAETEDLAVNLDAETDA